MAAHSRVKPRTLNDSLKKLGDLLPDKVFLGPSAFGLSSSMLSRSLSAVAIPCEANALSAAEAAERAERAGVSAQARASLEAALEAIVEGQAPGRVLICGSLYLAGRVLAAHG